MIRTDEEYESARGQQDAEAVKERARARELWRRFEEAPDAAAESDLVLGDPDFRSWAFCERLCHASVEAAEVDDAVRAGELTDLALKLAAKVPGDEILLCRVREHIWMHVCNARRAAGDLDGAGKALVRAQEYFGGSVMGVLPNPIGRNWHTLIEAALLRDRGRVSEALEKVAHSLSGHSDVDASVATFLEEGRLYRWLGRSAKALDPFSYADRHTSRVSNPRLLLRLEVERGLALCDLGRHGEVKEIPARLREVAARTPMDQGRLLCLQGRTAAGLGQPEKAEEALRTVLADLHDRVVVDAALLCLELAALYARLGRKTELEALAGTLQRLAESPVLKRGTAAALRLFCRLVEQDKMTAERAAQFARDFPRGPL